MGKINKYTDMFHSLGAVMFQCNQKMQVWLPAVRKAKLVR